MKCEACKSEIDITTLEVRKDRTVERGGETEIEIGVHCKCGADYASYVKPSDLCFMGE